MMISFSLSCTKPMVVATVNALFIVTLLLTTSSNIIVVNGFTVPITTRTITKINGKSSSCCLQFKNIGKHSIISSSTGYVFLPSKHQQQHQHKKQWQRNVRRTITIESAGMYDDPYKDIYNNPPSATITLNKKTSPSQVKAATFNLIKAMVGSGLLALPAGLAVMSDCKVSLYPAIALLGIIGLLSGYAFSLYGRLIHDSKAKSLGEVWEKEKGKSSSWMISLASSTFCYGATLSYSIIIGDTFQNIIKTLGIKKGLLTSRSLWILLSTTTILWPLCNLSSLSALAPISMLGVASVLSTIGFLGWRCPTINLSSPYAAATTATATATSASTATATTGNLLSTLLPHQLPQFNTFNNGMLSFSSLILVSMAATAFLGHFSAPDIYHSLGNNQNNNDNNNVPKKVEKSLMTAGGAATIATNFTTATSTRTAPTASSSSVPSSSSSSKTLSDYNKVTIGGFASVTIINCLALAFGFLTFGGNSNGVILNNYSTLDPFATICRLFMSICVIGGYPFCIAACRSEIIEIWNTYKHHRRNKNKKNKNDSSSLLETTTKSSSSSSNNNKTLTFALLSSLAGLALIMKDAGFVVGLNGALMGSAMVYIFPSMLFLSHTSPSKMKMNNKNFILTKRLQLERFFCRFLIGFGIAAAIAGGGISIVNQYFPHLLLSS